MRVCRHYNGLVWERQPCNKGVNPFEKVAPPNTGWLKRIPCRDDVAKPQFICPHYSPYSEEELQAQRENFINSKGVTA